MVPPADKTWAERIHDSRECTGLARQRQNEPMTQREMRQRIPLVLEGDRKYYTKDLVEERDFQCLRDKGYQAVYVRSSLVSSRCDVLLKQLEAGAEHPRVKQVCRQEMSEEFCRKCLGD